MTCGRNDRLRELKEKLQKDLFNYLVKEIYKGKTYVLNPLADRNQNKNGKKYSVIAFFLQNSTEM